jgi:hypothetical protein
MADEAAGEGSCASQVQQVLSSSGVVHWLDAFASHDAHGCGLLHGKMKQQAKGTVRAKFNR